MTFSRRAGGFLLGVAVWSWVIWPTFLHNIAEDPRAFSAGAPTGFFLVHLVLTVVSLALGTGCGVLGWRALRGRRLFGTVEAATPEPGMGNPSLAKHTG